MPHASNPWLERRVLCYAHQGGAKEAPSSTLYALEQALRAGADAIELDVHRSADGALVVCHDATLDRTTDGRGPIAEHSVAELRALDNAFSFVPGEDAQPGRDPAGYPLRGRAPADRALGVALLEEVLTSFPGVLLNLDVKQTAPAVPAYEEALARMLRAHRRVSDVIVASFDDRSTAAVAAFAPEIGTSPGAAALALLGRALVTGGEIDPTIRRHMAVQVPPSFGGQPVVNERFVEIVHGLGLAVHVWTINDPAEMAALARLGVDGIMTDKPSVLARVLDEAGSTYRGGAGGD